MNPEVKLQPCFLTPRLIQPQFPLFIYLPGMDGTGQLLRTQTAGLEVGFDVRCLAIPRKDLTSWDELTLSVLDLIHIELDKNSTREVYLCGESFGGCLAQKIAIASPKLFKRIILINPASSFHLRSWYSWASLLIYFVPHCFFEIGAIGLLPFLVALTKVKREIIEEILETVRSIPPETILWRLSLIREFYLDPKQLRQLTQPVLLIGSTGDRLLPSVPEVIRLKNILPNAKMTILPDSGHACLLEEAINLYEIMQSNNFLSKDAQIQPA